MSSTQPGTFLTVGCVLIAFTSLVLCGDDDTGTVTSIGSEDLERSVVPEQPETVEEKPADSKLSVSRLIETDAARSAPVKSEENLRTQLFRIPAPRGLIIDRYRNPFIHLDTRGYSARWSK